MLVQLGRVSSSWVQLTPVKSGRRSRKETVQDARASREAIKNVQIYSDLVRFTQMGVVFCMWIGRIRVPKSDIRRESGNHGGIWGKCVFDPNSYFSAGGILKRDSVTMQCLWGDS